MRWRAICNATASMTRDNATDEAERFAQLMHTIEEPRAADLRDWFRGPTPAEAMRAVHNDAVKGAWLRRVHLSPNGDT